MQNVPAFQPVSLHSLMSEIFALFPLFLIASFNKKGKPGGKVFDNSGRTVAIHTFSSL